MQERHGDLAVDRRSDEGRGTIRGNKKRIRGEMRVRLSEALSECLPIFSETSCFVSTRGVIRHLAQVRVEALRFQRPRALREPALSPRAPEFCPLGGGGFCCGNSCTLLAGAAQIDDFSHQLFLRKVSIETTLALS
jgi:hypothetical protein